MKKILGLCVALCPMIANADTLDDKIASLIAEKNAKIAELEKCQKATGNLKIAGITTLGVSAIGVAVNVGEAVSLNKLDDKIDAAQAQKANLDKQIGDARAAKLAAERAAKEAEQKAREKAARENELLAKQAEDNTCGPDSKQDIDVDIKNILNASQAVYVNGAWVASICADGYEEQNLKTCTRDGQVIEYAELCKEKVQNEEDVADSAEEVNEEIKEEEELHDDSGESVVTPQNRKYHDMCTQEETEKIQYAAESWWYNGKCVVKSCQDGAYLIVKNGASQGYCSKSCSGQISDWEQGGKACDIASQRKRCDPYSRKTENEAACRSYCYNTVPATYNCTVDEYKFSESGFCECNPKSHAQKVDESTKKSLVEDVKPVNVGVAEQKNDTTTVATQKYVESVEKTCDFSQCNKTHYDERYAGSLYEGAGKRWCENLAEKYCCEVDKVITLGGTGDYVGGVWKEKGTYCTLKPRLDQSGLQNAGGYGMNSHPVSY